MTKKTRYYDCKSQSICPGCSVAPAVEGKVYCRDCGENNKQRKRTQREQAKERGLCSRCFERPRDETYTTCNVCRNAQKNYNEKWVKKSSTTQVDEVIVDDDSTNTKCYLCGKGTDIGHPSNRPVCTTCYYKRTSLRCFGASKRWEELEDLLISQNYTCPYTGERLIPGINASVDHILPKSRFPQYKNDIDNLEWVVYNVNIAKNDLSREEFLAMIKRIYDYSVKEQ